MNQKLRKNKYLAICSRFRFPPELSTKENYGKAQTFVNKNLMVPHIEITSPALKKLVKMIGDDPSIRMCLTRMTDEALAAGNISKKRSLSEIVGILQAILKYSPKCNTQEPAESWTLPLAALYGPLADTESGEILALRKDMTLFWREYLAEYCNFLSSPDSAHVLNKEDGWLSPPGWEYMNMDDYVIPAGGYTSWNHFFIRELKTGVRPIARKYENTVITSPVDAQVWNYQQTLTGLSEFWAKATPYCVRTLLGNNQQSSEAAQYYMGGSAMQQVLFTEDYHRWHAPVSGTVTRVELLRGAYFSNMQYKFEEDTSVLKHWTGNMPYMAHLNNRMVIEIDTDESKYTYKHGCGNVGKVTFVAVGLQDVSSCVAKKQNGEDLKFGDSLAKGDQMGYFQFGGSTVICLFPPDCIKSLHFTPPSNPFIDEALFKMGEQVATANLQKMPRKRNRRNPACKL